jgi:hypothetical protein
MSIQALFALADRIQGVDPAHPTAKHSYAESLQQLGDLTQFARTAGSPETVACIVSAGHAIKALSGRDPHLDAERVQRGAGLLLRAAGDALTRHRTSARAAGVAPGPAAAASAPPRPAAPAPPAALGAPAEPAQPAPPLPSKASAPPGPPPARAAKIAAAELARATPDDMLLGQILLRLGHVTAEQVERALAMHREKGMAIGECLLMTGACAPERVLEALQLQQRLRGGAAPGATVVPVHPAAPHMARPAGAPPIEIKTPPVQADFHVTTDIFLGEVLLGAEMITKEQLESAMRMHHLKRVRVGEALVELGALTADQVDTGIELQRSLQSIAQKTARPAQRT